MPDRWGASAAPERIVGLADTSAIVGLLDIIFGEIDKCLNASPMK